jgi:hypothetical protein
VLALGLALARLAGAEPVLDVAAGGEIRHFTASALLARPDVADVNVPRDVAYGRPMVFRAVPLLSLLPPGIAPDALEARATDGFVSQLPYTQFRGPATAWIAVEDPSHPWPNLPGKDMSAGPFYLVWQNPGLAGISSEQWPYALTSLTTADDPVVRWPQLAVDHRLAANDPARRGQAVFAASL